MDLREGVRKAFVKENAVAETLELNAGARPFCPSAMEPALMPGCANNDSSADKLVCLATPDLPDNLQGSNGGSATSCPVVPQKLSVYSAIRGC